jgi:peptide/nickel transport system ATP-binding protein
VAVLEVERLRVELSSGADVVADVSFAIAAGEVLGLVGESGSGKTTVGVALLGDARRGAHIAGGSVIVDDVDVLGLDARGLRRIRGGLIAYIPQEPAAALNPALKVRGQLLEGLEAHGIGADRAEREARLHSVLEEVGLPSDASFLRRFPHQLSGGQQQRVAIAMAFACQPKVLVLDEPTTGVDVTTQARILKTVREMCSAHGVAALYITHDLAVVQGLAHRVMVMYAGRVVELARRSDAFTRPSHPYTKALMNAVPDVAAVRVLDTIPGRTPLPGMRPSGCFFAPRCSLCVPECVQAEPALALVADDQLSRCIRAADVLHSRVSEPGTPVVPSTDRSSPPILTVSDLSASHGDREILHGVALDLRARECLALVGESGSGKTTLARCIAGLHHQRSGDLLYRAHPLELAARDRSEEHRRAVQYIFQNPYTALNPRRTVGETVATPLAHFTSVKRSELRAQVAATLERVSLPRAVMSRYPAQLSGGERQRVAIARALICGPEILVCDEITSALDVSVQAAILDLLRDLQQDREVALLFITHNLAVARAVADRVVVMQDGRIVETADTDTLFTAPAHPYTQTLMAQSRAAGVDGSQRTSVQVSAAAIAVPSTPRGGETE